MPLPLQIWVFVTKYFAWAITIGAWLHQRGAGQARARFAERLGRSSLSRPAGPVIWVHAASLGEIGQARELIQQLQHDGHTNILVTTMTATGADYVTRELPQVAHQFVPLDTATAVSRFLAFCRPQIAIFVEGDLWPRLVIETNTAACPLILLNARPSKSRDRASMVYGNLLGRFAAITCKSQAVATTIAALGVSPERIHDFGDLRADTSPLPVSQSDLAELTQSIGNRPVWIAASTHEGDESTVIAACKAVITTQPDALLIWAPRHPNRAPTIKTALTRHGITAALRSNHDLVTPQTQVYIANTMGEFGTLFETSKVVFLGGSFGDEGGHNPYEPAQSSCAIISGPNVKNHADGFDALVKCGGAFIVDDGFELGAKVASLLTGDQAIIAGNKAQAAVATSAGATEKTVTLIEEILMLTPPR